MSLNEYPTIIMKPTDSVATALKDIPSQAEVTVNISEEVSKKITLKEPVAFGHKFAVHTIKKGEDILKYGEVIGRAVRDIEEGEHVHVHNLEGTRGRGDKIVNE
ncbi:UxaA family hydrolase [Schinkia azotoformans]|uniref:UxaA family hydrolase n=1 Tax=Schinkia azotoformans TaxID=1454 RepID=UPI002DBCA0F7|nr:UxaA family hydrolase [Schinkia azotoformans]MEC1715033.1 UxaA family hydrolase [Schinkia azotoformans]MEC1740267.1 UxaA family hydrolase [Schinkia azotoformans]MEC1746895.1 UxaA family hydrolase [Schinkia azotoformans]MEC1766154.1 UxaA family hydrolase [Schinkia azotoformans]MEC1770543.1 UxaA family hydrolase [Schinkia azotoformans]